MRVIIAGGRDIVDARLIHLAIDDSRFVISEVVSGGSRGVDILGEAWAQRWGVPVKRFPADWKQYGAKAGPLRNRAMAQYADACIVIWDGKSRGSASMCREARLAKIRLFQWRVD